jgi:serine/tyrosine/threonine adenylyltransferase
MDAKLTDPDFGKDFHFDNSFAREMEGFYVPWQGAAAPSPRVVKFNHTLAEELGLAGAGLAENAGILSGAPAPEGAAPLAMVYAGHQFGQFSPQLGDGRALLLGEIVDRHGRRRDLQLKGSGRTPFSRGGDGKAVLGPVLREYLMGEAMHALGIPTTRALAAVTTGETVYRETLLPGAVLARVASSHLRVGTFEFFAARGETEKLRRLADYAIGRHDPALANAPDRYLRLLEALRDRQAALVARWMQVGFVHGVMNTDNMAISGETIDYGPCAFLDAYDPATVFSSIDRDGRYAFANQPRIALWNLARFAEALLPLIAPDDPARAVAPATAVLDGFNTVYQAEWIAGMRAKIGLGEARIGDEALIADLLAQMARHGADYTGFFRDLARGAFDPMELAAVQARLGGDEFVPWLARWQARLAAEGTAPADGAARIRRASPARIPRNHHVERALEAAIEGDIAPFERLLAALQSPFEDDPAFADLAAPPAPGGPAYRTFCGT